MEFGKVRPEDVPSINFKLPEDGQQNSKVLNKKNEATADIFIGCAKWSLPEWVGFLYPLKTKAANFLPEYARHFNSIELNAAYYKIPSIETVRKWQKQAAGNAKNGFLFCPKFPETISHHKRLKGAESATDEFLASVVEFGESLGPCFLQMSDSFGPNSLSTLADFLRSLPEDLNVFTELRNEEWFSDPSYRKQVFELFSSLHDGAVITDVAGRRDVLHMEVTIPEVFIRFIGNGAAFREADYARIDAWAERIKTWQDRGLKKVYFFLHQHDELESVRLAAHTVKSFNQTLGSQIPEIQLQPSLFI
ncbi:DUF72 domain-containing protein [Pedobacter sp. MC2016-15]|uniref:DUF72 domain-containing protein n=1 Tax=Pedobacter sp. MC2016-15 TaxID=2994473 RepID=UPI002245797F|nr:DUF72 domain-containing protein [Pedobacter sp. MC2016-15]MCX2479637.1 DUF72 domain-containing protein [Pedobacter sp. MC2016-15]